VAIWETILTLSIPATVTAASLIYQQRRADQRERDKAADERARRQEEREDAAHRRQEEQAEAARARELELAAARETRRVTLADEWRADRRQIHTRLLTLLDSAYALLDRHLIFAVLHNDETPFFEADEALSTHALNEDLRREIEDAASAVELLASEDAAAAGGEAARKLLALDVSLYLGETVTGAEINRAATQYRELRRKYQAAAREDLGTST
jgi:hypothetical protein